MARGRGHPTGVAVVLMAAGYDPAEEFTFGLDLVLDALERLVPS